MPTCLTVSACRFRGVNIVLEDEPDRFYGLARHIQTGGIPQRLAQIGERTSSPRPTWVDCKMRFPPIVLILGIYSNKGSEERAVWVDES